MVSGVRGGGGGGGGDAGASGFGDLDSGFDSEFGGLGGLSDRAPSRLGGGAGARGLGGLGGHDNADASSDSGFGRLYGTAPRARTLSPEHHALAYQVEQIEHRDPTALLSLDLPRIEHPSLRNASPPDDDSTPRIDTSTRGREATTDDGPHESSRDRSGDPQEAAPVTDIGNATGQGAAAPMPGLRQAPTDAPPLPPTDVPAPSATLQALARTPGAMPRQWQLEILNGHQAPVLLQAERQAAASSLPAATSMTPTPGPWALSLQMTASQAINAMQLDRLATRLARGGIAVESLRAGVTSAHADLPPFERIDDDVLDDGSDDLDRDGQRR